MGNVPNNLPESDGAEEPLDFDKTGVFFQLPVGTRHANTLTHLLESAKYPERVRMTMDTKKPPAYDPTNR